MEEEIGSSLQASEELSSPFFEGKAGKHREEEEKRRREELEDVEMLRSLKEMRISLEERLLQKGSLSQEEKYMLHIIREQEGLL